MKINPDLRIKSLHGLFSETESEFVKAELKLAGLASSTLIRTYLCDLAVELNHKRRRKKMEYPVYGYIPAMHLPGHRTNYGAISMRRQI
jgi:hypothetical protein